MRTHRNINANVRKLLEPERGIARPFPTQNNRIDTPPSVLREKLNILLVQGALVHFSKLYVCDSVVGGKEY
jgi:hypothetical protein